jgi:hypothetical protein
MRVRLVMGALFIAVLAVAAVAAVEPSVGARQQGIAFFLVPTQVAGVVVQGKTLIVHDDQKMARGEPCTTIYGYHGKVAKPLVSFMCKPEARPVARKMVVTCVHNNFTWNTDVMTEYQFAGEAEAHGVPSSR